MPRDYAKEYRRFRPSNESNMKTCFKYIRQCRNGRIYKPSLKAFRSLSHNTTTAQDRPPSRVDGPSAHLVSHSESGLIGHSLSTSKDPQTIPPAILLLNTSTDLNHLAPEHLPTSSIDSKLSDITTINVGNIGLANSEHQPDTSQTKSSMSNRVHSLRQKLLHPYSLSYVEHVSSVLRYCSSNSWRSSILSITSHASSLKSMDGSRTRGSITKSQNFEATDKEPLEPNVSPAEFRTTAADLSEHEQEVWDEQWMILSSR